MGGVGYWNIKAMKRLTDILVSGLALIVLSPFIAVLVLLVRMDLGSPVLFRQMRPGFKGRPFMMVKFRTMRDASDANGVPLPDGVRLTKFGRWLRSSSLDELPELWNVLRGEMSLVGPRPLLMEYLALYSPEQARRHDVPPGVTGWAQVNGRNALSWDEKFALDIWYVENHTVLLDLKILMLTLWKVVSRKGISAAGSDTMTDFLGNDPAQQKHKDR